MELVRVPDTLVSDIDSLVAEGTFASRDAAVAELLRLGLDSFRGGGRRPFPRPPAPPIPPGRREPTDDSPIDVDPGRDVNWV